MSRYPKKAGQAMNKPRFDLADLKAAAHGRWPEIHVALGIPAEYLNPRKHRPCPHCGGRDRYRYTDHQGTGAFICNQCTPEGGSGFDLLMLVFGYDFAEACRQVAAVLGLSGSPTGQHAPRDLPAAAPAQPHNDKQPALWRQWQAACPLADGDPVTGYLKTRGLPLPDPLPAALRYAPSLAYWAALADCPRRISSQPAMLAAITTPDGQLQGLHQTYLQHDCSGWHKWAHINHETGEPLPAKKMQSRFAGALNGAAVHLAAPDVQGRLLVAEGIETALAASALFGLPAAAALSANGMAAFAWPPEAAELFICADHDENGTGQAAAESLARRALLAGIKAKIWLPETAGFDALDEYRHRKGQA